MACSEIRDAQRKTKLPGRRRAFFVFHGLADRVSGDPGRGMASHGSAFWIAKQRSTWIQRNTCSRDTFMQRPKSAFKLSLTTVGGANAQRREGPQDTSSCKQQLASVVTDRPKPANDAGRTPNWPPPPANPSHSCGKREGKGDTMIHSASLPLPSPCICNASAVLS